MTIVGNSFAVVFHHWMRWIAIGLVGAYGLGALAPSHPYWVLFAVAFLGYFLIESTLSWFAINDISYSERPIFPHLLLPRFEPTRRGDEWPTEKPFIELRNWLRKQDLTRMASLVAQMEDQEVQRIAVYRNEADTVRVHVLFLPHRENQFFTCFAIHSLTAQGERLVTDNIFLPFGGFYPENWRLERLPGTSSLPELWQRHLARMDAHGGPFAALETDPARLINDDQRKLERLNEQLGYLSNAETEEDEGRITAAGRFRFWAELWMLRYLGRTYRY